MACQPVLSGSAGPEAAVVAVPVEGGGFRQADEAYLRDSILQPAKQVVAGFAPLMPSFAGLVGEDELQRLVAYIRSLREEKSP